MQITANKVVSIDYTLTDANGQVLDTSEGGSPLAYLHGNGQLIRGLEKELEGKAKGDAFKVTVPAPEAYGLRDDAKVITVPKSRIQGVDIKVGTQLQAEGGHGAQIVTVVAIDGDNVILDANHPLAGQNLTFDVAVRDVREATEDELSHGHAHGPGGHHHH